MRGEARRLWCTWYKIPWRALHRKRTHLRSVERANHAASIGKSAGRERGPEFIAKVRVAGSNPVVRSKEKSSSEVIFVSAEWVVGSALY